MRATRFLIRTNLAIIGQTIVGRGVGWWANRGDHAGSSVADVVRSRLEDPDHRRRQRTIDGDGGSPAKTVDYRQRRRTTQTEDHRRRRRTTGKNGGPPAETKDHRQRRRTIGRDGEPPAETDCTRQGETGIPRPRNCHGQLRRLLAAVLLRLPGDVIARCATVPLLALPNDDEVASSPHNCHSWLAS